MADTRKIDWRRRTGLAVAAASLLVAGYLELGRPPVGSGLLNAGYSRRVAALLEAGEVRGALAELEESTLLDTDAAGLIGRMRPVSSLAPVVRRDVALRTGIAQAVIAELGSTRGLDAEQRGLLDLATGNGETLVELDPGGAQSHLLLGLVYLKRGEVAGAPIDFMRSARHLRVALALDPEIAAAANALRIALGRLEQSR